jgi:hypothetical protein
MDFEISGRSRANAWRIDYISVGNKKIAVTAAVTWYRGIRETFNFLILMLLIILTGTTETDLEDGQERLLKLLYLGQFDNGSGTLATIGNRNFGNYWFYLGQQEILLWFMVEKTLIHLLLYYPPIHS